MRTTINAKPRFFRSITRTVSSTPQCPAGCSSRTYVATWAGFVYAAFVINAYGRKIVGWRRQHRHASFILDA